MGLALGARWEDQPTAIDLVGSLGQYEARGLLLDITQPAITGNQRVRQVFAWTKAPSAKLLLGQMSFFLTFDVCFHRADLVFEVTLQA